jgi:glycosyltransferase involved in cell wall biosynthesis
LLIPPADASALASAMHRLLSCPADRERFGARARDRAVREFGIGAMTDGYERLYRGEHRP